jgi:hypothetical protein
VYTAKKNYLRKNSLEHVSVHSGVRYINGINYILSSEKKINVDLIKKINIRY